MNEQEMEDLERDEIEAMIEEEGADERERLANLESFVTWRCPQCSIESAHPTGHTPTCLNRACSYKKELTEKVVIKNPMRC